MTTPEAGTGAGASARRHRWWRAARPWVRSCLLGACLLACDDQHPFGGKPAEPIDLRGKISAQQVPLLGPVEVRLDLYAGKGVQVAFDPAVPEGFTGRVEARGARSLGTGEWREWRLHLRPAKVGDLKVPPFRAEAADGTAATTPEWTVHVTSLLEGHKAELEAPAPPFPPRPDVTPWLAGGAALVVLAALLWWWRRRRRREHRAPSETPLPPHVTALRALGRLRNAPRSTPEQVELFYVEVSAVLRRYLEDRFGLRAPERTTEEFLDELRGGDALSVEHRHRLAQFLQQCDLVKFARAFPGEEVHQRTFDVAESFVEATREDRAHEGVA